MRSAPSSSHSGNLLQDPFLVRRHLLLHILQDSLQLDVLLLQDGELRLLLRQLPLPLCPAAGCSSAPRWRAPSPPPPTSSSSLPCRPGLPGCSAPSSSGTSPSPSGQPAAGCSSAPRWRAPSPPPPTS